MGGILKSSERKWIIIFLTIITLVVGFLFAIGIGGENLNKASNLNLGIRHHVSQPYIPQKLDFAGENVPLHIPDVFERLERELLINVYWESNSMLMMKRGARWFPLIDSILNERGIPADFRYLPIVESRLSNEISEKGAAGFWHLMPATARELGLIVNDEMDERYDPVRSTEAAADFLLRARDMFGSWTMAAGAFNRGMNGLRRAVNHQRQNNYFDLKLNDESARYLFRILAFKIIFSEPKRQGFYMKKSELYVFPEFETVFVDKPVDWVRFASNNGLSYKHLRIWNPWIQNKRFRNLSGQGINIWLLKEPRYAVTNKDWDSLGVMDENLESIPWDPAMDTLYIDRVE